MALQELADYQITKRKEYEDGIRKNRLCIANWIKYAKWEESQVSPALHSPCHCAHCPLLSEPAPAGALRLRAGPGRGAPEHLHLAPGSHLHQFKGKGEKGSWPPWQYAEFEMRQKQINHARNIWDRAVTIQPRVKQFWLKYAYMEEVLGNLPGARQVPQLD